jgi:hypothetical protein
MSKAVKISEALAAAAALFAKVEHRSVAGQVEYWARLGKIAEENPDLPISFIKDILLGREELRAGQKTPYVFGEGE